MAEVERLPHFGNVSLHQFGIAAVAVAAEHQRATSDRFAASKLDAFNESVLVGEQCFARAPGQDWDVALLYRAAQPVDQLGSRAARQSVHTMRRMARIVEV